MPVSLFILGIFVMFLPVVATDFLGTDDADRGKVSIFFPVYHELTDLTALQVSLQSLVLNVLNMHRF